MPQKSKNGFVVLDSSPELKVKITASTLEDLFLVALEGMSALLVRNHNATSIAQIAIPVKISSVDINSLLVDFLSEALYHSEIRQAIFFTARMRRFNNSELEAELAGRPVSKFERNIKAVTYHGVRILRNKEGFWETEIVFNL